MSVVRVAVPVLHGRRRFHFDKGRRWSLVEHVILDALTRQSDTASRLAEQAAIPRRVVIESLIRLMRAGWVELVTETTGVTFRSTPNGKLAAALDELPAVPRRLSRVMNFVVDQVSGTIYRSRELTFYHKHVVEQWAITETIVYLKRPSEEIDTQVRPLVEALFLDDEKFVSMDWSGDRLSERWALVTVRDDEPEGLPTRAPVALLDAVKEAALAAPKNPRKGQHIEHSRVDYGKFRTVTELKTHTVDLSGADLVLGGQEHFDMLRRVLKGARYRVVIHSTFISTECFMDILPIMEKALGRGVVIDVLWGQNDIDENVKSSREAVKQIQKVVSSRSLENLRLHPFSTASHCKILISDVADGRGVCAWVGSCNWLSSKFQSFEGSIRLKDERIVADVVDQVVELSKGANGHWIPLTNELAALAASLRSRARSVNGRCEAQVVLGTRHADIVRKARDESKQRMFVTSHRFGVAGLAAVLDPAMVAANSNGLEVSLYYGTASASFGGTNVATATMNATAAGVRVRPVRNPQLHAKLLAWDEDAVVVTSQNWLSADPSDSRPRQEIGVFVRAPGLANNLIRRFEAVCFE